MSAVLLSDFMSQISDSDRFHIYIDADACPVRDEVYKIALRHEVRVSVISNSYLRVPTLPKVKRIVVSDSFDAADDYIAERADTLSIVITADILLAERCLKSSARVIAPTGKPFTDDSIGSAIAVRALMADLRSGIGNENLGGPAPFSNADRSRFLQTLHEALTQMKKA